MFNTVVILSGIYITPCNHWIYSCTGPFVNPSWLDGGLDNKGGNINVKLICTMIIRLLNSNSYIKAVPIIDRLQGGAFDALFADFPEFDDAIFC